MPRRARDVLERLVARRRSAGAQPAAADDGRARHHLRRARRAQPAPGDDLDHARSGCSGPRRDWQATDLTLWNAGGIAYLNGSPEAEDLPPLAPFGRQAEYQGALNGAIASLGALFARLRSGRGQHVVVSIQESLAAILELTFEYWPYMGLIASRLGRKPIQPLDFLECTGRLDLHLLRRGASVAGVRAHDRQPGVGASWSSSPTA